MSKKQAKKNQVQTNLLEAKVYQQKLKTSNRENRKLRKKIRDLRDDKIELKIQLEATERDLKKGEHDLISLRRDFTKRLVYIKELHEFMKKNITKKKIADFEAHLLKENKALTINIEEVPIVEG